MEKQAILVLIKPDGLVKSLTGNIISRLSEAKLGIIGTKMVRVSDELARTHYHELAEKPFFSDLISYLQGKLHSCEKTLAMVYYGEDAIRKVRTLAGATNPEDADSISIRGAYGRITTKGVFENVIHASSSPQDAEREIKLWFSPDEIIIDLYPAKIEEHKETSRIWT